MRRWFRNLFKRLTPALEPYPEGTAPNRFQVVRLPSMVFEYVGTEGSKARRAWEANAPMEGEVLEFRDQGVCRGRK